MRNETEPLSRHDLEAKIVKRCWEDEAFRREFTADPEGAFVKYLQVPATSLPKIVVHQEEAGSWHIVLPPKPANTAELSEQELEKIAGGSAIFVSAVLTAAASASASAASISATYSLGEVLDSAW